MPEGPSLVLLKEAARPLAEGRRIEQALGTATAIGTAALPGRRVVSVRTWGKHSLLELDGGCTVRVHFPALARRRLRARPDLLACDALLDQDVFAGLGNIIKNEVLFRIRVHPLSPVGALPAARLRELVAQARKYAFELGRTARIACYCERCQELFGPG